MDALCYFSQLCCTMAYSFVARFCVLHRSSLSPVCWLVMISAHVTGFHRTAGALCPAGYFCTTMAAAPTVCPIGYYCQAGTANTTLTLCSGGVYGASTGLQSPSCSGNCAAGYYCPPGATSAHTSQCNTSAVYCPSAVQAPVSVSPGYYSVPVGGSLASAQSPCGMGYYCAGGVQIPCPAGVYGDQAGETTPGCAGACAAGYYCPAGSTRATAVPCGNVTVYCPSGASWPLVVLGGYYTVGVADITTQSSQAICPTGSYCVGGVRASCPFGVFGSTTGLHTAACSGACLAGYVCPVGSRSGSSMLCSAGFYCNHGAVTSCPPGTYNDKTGQWAFGNCTACPANTFSSALNASSLAACTPCAKCENSTAGAAVCWPGVVSAVASNPPPVIPSLSAGDILTITFSKPTNAPPMYNDAEIHAVLVFSSFIGVGLVGAWNHDASSVAITIGATNAPDGTTVDLAATAVGVLTMTLNATSNLRDAATLSQPASYGSIYVSGSWGVASVPVFLPPTGLYSPSFAANTGLQAGLGIGDSLMLRFNNPCKQVAVATKANIDALLLFSSPIGLNYTGSWVTSGWFAKSAINITVTKALPTGANATATAVGVLRVTVRASAGMTSLDRTTAASNASTVIGYGTWGDVPTASVAMRSYKTLRVTMLPPASRRA
jgi:hypothetical protein